DAAHNFKRSHPRPLYIIRRRRTTPLSQLLPDSSGDLLQKLLRFQGASHLISSLVHHLYQSKSHIGLGCFLFSILRCLHPSVFKPVLIVQVGVLKKSKKGQFCRSCSILVILCLSGYYTASRPNRLPLLVVYLSKSCRKFNSSFSSAG